MPLLSSGTSNFFTLPFRKKKQRYTINPPDESLNVIYLGNVLTVMARGENCFEKPLSLIWKAYCTRNRSDLHMSLENFQITRSGLKAETKQQGLTEYWAHKITFSAAPQQYPKVFCWIYKHDGKRLKPELRCHAVLCKKNAEPAMMHMKLQEFLQSALQEYRREKMAVQNARLTGSNGCPRRKLLLQTGSLNFRPPVSRSKSAPRLGSIDEELEEEELSDNESICYRTRGDAASQADRDSQASFSSEIPTTSHDERSSGCSASTSSSTCSSTATEEEDRRRKRTEIDSISDESGYHEEKQLIRANSDDLFYSDSELVILEEDYDDDDEENEIQVTAL